MHEVILKKAYSSYIHESTSVEQSAKPAGTNMPEMESVKSVGVNSRGSKFSKMTIQRNTCGPDDVTIDIKYCPYW